MKSWRKTLDRLLLASAVFLALVVVIILVSTIRATQEARRSIGSESAIFASQLEYDAFQFLDHIDRFASPGQSVSKAQMQVRFDVLWSRVFNPHRLSAFGQKVELLKETSEMFEQSQVMLERLEPLVAQLEPDDAKTIADLKQAVRELLPFIHRNVMATRQQQILSDTSFLQDMIRQKYMSLTLVFGIALFGIVSMILLRVDGRRIQNLNARLEDRVLKRTGDLQAANGRLAAEIAERKRTQSMASEREARLAQAIQLAKLGYYIWDAVEEKCEFCSDLHAATRGLTPAEYIEKSITDRTSLNMVHVEDREKVRVNYHLLRAGHMIETEYRVSSPIGIRRIREVARPVFDSAGRVVRELGSSMDVTDQYETEMKLFEAQRMDSIGKMTGGVAHDFNNLLAVILGNLELLREVPESEEREEMISDAIHAALRGRDLTMNMLSFARRAPLDPKELDLNMMLSEMEGMLRRTLPQNISFQVDLVEEAWTVMADRSQTESAVLNLVINARDAMEAGGDLTITTSNVSLVSDNQIVESQGVEPGDYVMMTIADSGCGIDPALLDTIFDPFFTTKAITKNSGLGLSMVQGFIAQTGGAIHVESSPGTGTIFALYFKAVHGANPLLPSELEQSDETFVKGNRVLLIEDDETVLKVLKRQLEGQGLKVVTALEGDGARQAFATQGPFDIVVSDIVMPGELQGPALVQKLRESYPELPAVFLSGYPQDHLSDSGDQTLMKPVSASDLLVAIKTALST